MGLNRRRTEMAKKGHKPEEAVAKLRQVDVLVSQGRSVADAIRAIGVTEVTCYRWRREFGGLKSGQVKRLKALEAENARLRRAVSDPTLDKQKLGGGAGGRAGGGERAPAPRRFGPDLGQADPGGGGAGKLLGPARRRACVEHVRRGLPASERRARAPPGARRRR